MQIKSWNAKLRRYISLKRQLRCFRYVMVISAKLTQRIFDSHAQSNYAQFGEDTIIGSFFLNSSEGVYVDIGCNHPIRYSNTWKLYLRGWRGLAVDPNPKCISQFKKVRSRDVAIQCVVSNSPDPVEFYFSKDSDLISGVGEKNEGHWQRTAENSMIVTCQPVTLTRLLEEHHIPEAFNLLSVDVEGHELSVIESLDLGRYHPELIVVELHDFELAQPTNNAVYNYLTDKEYSLLAYMGPSAFFRRKREDG